MQAQLVRSIQLSSSAHPNLAIEASFIERDGRDRWFLGGSLNGNHEAWAAQVDDKGTKIWEYARGLQQEDVASLPSQFSARAVFRGGAVAPNGIHFLCGSLPRAPGKPTAAFIDTLDASGKLLREQLYYSTTKTGDRSAELNNCVMFGDVLIGIGRKNMGGYGLDDNWIIAIDLQGKVQWDRTFARMRSDPATSFQGITSARLRDYLAICVTDNSNTDVFLVAKDGSILRSRTFGGGYLLVQDWSPRTSLALYGDIGNGSELRTAQIITLSEQLADESITVGESGDRFVARWAGRLQDGTLLGFGSIINPVSGSYRPGISVIEGDLKSPHLEPIDAVEGKSGWSVLAAGSSSRQGEFVAVTPFLGTSTRGASLHFVTVN
jgi:hypothetical protein